MRAEAVGSRLETCTRAVCVAEVGGRARGPQVAGVPTCRGRRETAGRSAGPDVSAPLAPALPLRTRRQSRSAPLGSARLGSALLLRWLPSLGLGSAGSAPRLAGPDTTPAGAQHGPGSGARPGAHLPALRARDRDSGRYARCARSDPAWPRRAPRAARGVYLGRKRKCGCRVPGSPSPLPGRVIVGCAFGVLLRVFEFVVCP